MAEPPRTTWWGVPGGGEKGMLECSTASFASPDAQASRLGRGERRQGGATLDRVQEVLHVVGGEGVEVVVALEDAGPGREHVVALRLLPRVVEGHQLPHPLLRHLPPPVPPWLASEARMAYKIAADGREVLPVGLQAVLEPAAVGLRPLRLGGRPPKGHQLRELRRPGVRAGPQAALGELQLVPLQ